MKLFKRVFIGLVMLVVLVFGAAAVFISLVDLNDYKDKIQNLTKTQTGRDLLIAGDLNVSYFPWIGISLGKLSLANADGFGDQPFAEIDSANVKVELMPLLRKTVNVKTVELKGLNIDLQRAADGTTNWDDLAQRGPSTTSTTDENNTTTEVEGDAAAIAALAVGGIDIVDANVSWQDKQAGTAAKLSQFNLKTGKIELAKPFDLETDFKVDSPTAGIGANVTGSGAITIDLENQRYTLDGFTLNTKAKGDTLPNGAVDLTLASSVIADLVAQSVDADKLSLSALGVTFNGSAKVTDLDTAPQVAATLTSEQFDPSELFSKLGIEPPVTADGSVLKSGKMSMALAANPSSATLKDLTIKLDDTTFNGSASLPNLAAAMPPVRFDFAVDAIDLDRYLPPSTDAVDTDAGTKTETASTTGDEPLGLPMDMLRQLDVDGVFKVGQLKIMNLTTNNIQVPVTAKGGQIKLDNIQASMYDGGLVSAMSLDATGNTPRFGFQADLSKVESDPLLQDLRQADSPMSGNANFSADITTTGDSVNALKAGLNGNFDAKFLDGSINGINIGYELRRAKALFNQQSVTEEEKAVKTDFSSLSISGVFNDGVLTSNDLDMRSPLLRLSGQGTVDLPKEYVDYTPGILVAGTVEGQGGADLDELKGLNIEVPVQGTFTDLSADFAGVILAGLKANYKNMAKAKLQAEADKLKAEAKAKLEATKAEAKAKLEAKKAEAKQRLAEEKQKAKAELASKQAAAEEEARAKLAAEEEAAKLKAEAAKEKAKKKLKNSLSDLLK